MIENRYIDYSLSKKDAVEIKIALLKKGMTRKELCEKLGFTTAFLSAVLNGVRKLPIKSLVKMQKELGIVLEIENENEIDELMEQQC
jgi:transcriptional regulator with XRE-family HTH domain